MSTRIPEDQRIARCILCGSWMLMPVRAIRNAAYMPVCSPCLEVQLEMASVMKMYDKSVNTL